MTRGVVEPAPSKANGVALLAAGWMAWALGVSLSLGAFAYIASGRFFAGRPAVWEIYLIFVAMLAGGGVAHFGQQARLTGRRHLAKRAQLPASDELFVLYLRSFREDTGRAGLERRWLRPEALIPPLFLGPLFLSGRSLEEHLIASVRDLGRVLSVGSPGERLSPAGAERLYLPADNWQEPVRRLMGRARLVLIALDGTPGNLWEFVEATRCVHPQRLLLVAPTSKETYDEFRFRASALLRERAEVIYRETQEQWSPPTLPDHRGTVEATVPAKKPVASGLIYYSSDWVPTFTLLVPWALYDVLSIAVRTAARPARVQLLTFEEAIDPQVRVRRRQALLLAMFGQSMCLLACLQAVSSLSSNAWGLPTEGGWREIAAGVALALGLVLMRVARRARLGAAPLPREEPPAAHRIDPGFSE